MTNQLPKIRTKTPKFRPPSIVFSIHGNMSISNIIENNDFKKLIQNISYNSIRFFKDKPSAKLFTIKNTNYCFNLDRKSYKNVLHKCLKDFEKIEDYEKCAECKQLIDTLS